MGMADNGSLECDSTRIDGQRHPRAADVQAQSKQRLRQRVKFRTILGLMHCESRERTVGFDKFENRTLLV